LGRFCADIKTKNLLVLDKKTNSLKSLIIASPLNPIKYALRNALHYLTG